MSIFGLLGVAGAIGSLFKKFTGGSIGSALIGDWANKRGMERQFNNQLALQDDAQSFNAEQAEINRNFNARQAELAREWQEQFYNKYQSPSAMMAQYKSAGINPMLVAGQGTGSPPSSSSASGSAASSGIGSAAAGNLVGDIVQLMTLKKQLQQMDAQTDLTRAEARGIDSQIRVNDSQIGLNSMSSQEISQRCKLLSAQTDNEKEKKGLIALQKTTESEKADNLKYDRLKKEWENNYYKIYGSYPSSGLWDAVRNLVELGRSKVALPLIESFTNHGGTLLDFKR